MKGRSRNNWNLSVRRNYKGEMRFRERDGIKGKIMELAEVLKRITCKGCDKNDGGG